MRIILLKTTGNITAGLSLDTGLVRGQTLWWPPWSLSPSSSCLTHRLNIRLSRLLSFLLLFLLCLSLSLSVSLSPRTSSLRLHCPLSSLMQPCEPEPSSHLQCWPTSGVERSGELHSYQGPGSLPESRPVVSTPGMMSNRDLRHLTTPPLTLTTEKTKKKLNKTELFISSFVWAVRQMRSEDC